MRRFVLFALLTATSALAQPLPFGSADDPTEVGPAPFARENLFATALGGPSYIGVEWRTVVGFEASGGSGPFAFGLSGRLHAGADGLYDPDVDELYDLLRIVQYVRYAPVQVPVYARVGPLRRLTLGPGHLVRNLGTTAAWEQRTVGVEAAVRLPLVEVAGFASDLFLEGPVGGRLTVAPLGLAANPMARSVRLGATAVTDPTVGAEHRPTAFAVDGAFDLMRLGDFTLAPFASYAWFDAYGSSLGLGVTFGSEELIGLGRLQARLGVFRSTDRFIPGYFNPFYPVSNPEARTWDADAYYADRTTFRAADTPLAEADGGTALLFELRALAFDAFELASYLRRGYTSTPTSELGLRLVVSPGRGRSFRFVFEVQRQGLTSFGSFFSDLEDENLLVFHLDYPISGPLRLYLRSRYGYEEVAEGPDGTRRFLVQRRFEPMLGVTYGF